jgi:tRNA nucleotidyltransferase (CCA-adding enzyme)
VAKFFLKLFRIGIEFNIMPKNYQKILKRILVKVTPQQKDKKELKKLARKALKLTNQFAKKYKAKAILAGSITRDTWMPDKKEFDIFVLFPESMSEKKMEKLGLEIGKKVIRKLGGKFLIEYAEHPYVSGLVNDIDIDIVPCYALKTLEKIKSAVDRTPFHVRYLEKNLPLELSKEVRLLKQFLKVNGLYGADLKTQGFSGYVCELLIIKYKSFLRLLRNATKWKPGEIIDLEKFYSKKDYPKLRKIFKNQPLILLDPTDKKRNTAAALSIYNFFKFKKIANDFLKNPSQSFFEPKKITPISEKELKKKKIERGMEIIFVRFKPPKVIPDILWPQLRKFAERLQKILEEQKYEFKVFGKDVYTNEKDLAIVLLEMEVSQLPPIQKRIGPLIFDLDDSKRFLNKHKKALVGPYVEDKFWVVEIRRKFLDAKQKLKDSLDKSLRILKAKGIPNFIAEQITKGFEIFSENEKIIQLIKKNPEFGIFLRKYFEKERLV